MLTPEYLLRAPEGAEEIAEQLHIDLIQRIVEAVMNRIGNGDEYLLTAKDKWQIDTLQQAGYLLEDIQAEVAKATDKQIAEIAQAMEDAGVRALEYDDAIYREAGLDPIPLVQSPQMIAVMQRGYEATIGEWINFTRTTATASQLTFIRACDKAYNLAISGAISPSKAVREALEDVVSDGVYVEYPTGHRDTIETATARAVRTGIAQASGEIQLARMDEYGWDLVIVSSHLGARPSHAEWQGKIFSRSGTGYPDFVESTGYGSVTGLKGANCRHSFSPWFEGMENPFEQYDSEENRKAYELSQRQRVMERRIRDTKRRVMGWKAAMDAAPDEDTRAEAEREYQRLSALLQKQNKAYNLFCDEYGVKQRAARVHIARWNRSKASSASNAAQAWHNNWLKSIGAEDTTLDTVDKYLDAKYDETKEFALLAGYNRAVEKGDISPLVGFKQYKLTAAAVEEIFIGKTTANGVVLERYAMHFVDRIIGQTESAQDGMRQGVFIPDALDAITNPIKPPKRKTMANGDVRESYTGARAKVTISVTDRLLIQTNPAR